MLYYPDGGITDSGAQRVWLERLEPPNGLPAEDPCNVVIEANTGMPGLLAALTMRMGDSIPYIVLCPFYYRHRSSPLIPEVVEGGRALGDAASRWSILLHEMMHLYWPEGKSKASIPNSHRTLHLYQEFGY